MSDTRPEPCTLLRTPSRALYVPLVRHWSYVLASDAIRPGRSGTTVCGTRGAVDQDRANYQARNIRQLVKIDELPACERCMTFVRRLAA
jgi:hypothetical protein